MKGLVISLVAFVTCVPFTMVVAHVVKPRKFLTMFVWAFIAWTPVYFLLYFITPPNVYVLPQSWLSPITWLDVLYGYAILVLNFHSYLDTFFAFNGGFSMSLMLEVLRSGEGGITADELLSGFIGPDGQDKIYGRRIPNLEQMGCIRMDRDTGLCHLTPKGKLIATVDVYLKRFLNLSEGG